MTTTAHHRQRLFAVIAALVAILPLDGSSAQRIRIVAPGRPASAGPASTGAILQPSQEAESLIARAKEGIQRSDWKLAIDSLQRIVDLGGEHVLKVNDHRYESARMQAHRQIAALPAAGLQAYRTLNDGEAAALLEKARDQHDPVMLRTVVDRLLLTSSGDEAAVMLAEWLMDEGRFSEASTLLRTVRLVYPDSDLPGWLIPCRLSECFAAMGQYGRAEEMLSRAMGAQGGALIPQERVQRIRQFISRRQTAQPAETTITWPMVLGNVSRNGRLPGVDPSLLEQHCMTYTLPLAEPREGFTAAEELAVKMSFVPGRIMVTDGNVLITKAVRGLIALDPDSLTRIWTSEPPADPVETANDERVLTQYGNLGMSSNTRSLEVVLAAATSANADVTIAGDKALTITYPTSAFPLLPGLQTTEQGLILRMGGMGSVRAWPNRVTAYAIRDGSLLWQSDTTGLTGVTTAPAEETVCQFLAAPIPVVDILLAPCQVNNDLYLAALDPSNGKHRWHVYVCGMEPMGPVAPFSSLRLTVADDVAFVTTGQGLVVAVDVASRCVLWAARYPRAESVDFSWTTEAAVAVGDMLVCAPLDSKNVFCIDRATGESRWEISRAGVTRLLGTDGTHVWAAGNEVQMIDAMTGKPVWAKPCPQPTGRGVIAGDRIYLPGADGLVAFYAMSGEPVPLTQTNGPLVAGLFAWEGALYSIGLSEIRRYPDLVNGYRQAVARCQSDPANPSKAIRLAWLELLRNEPAAALAALEKLPENLKAEDLRRYEQVAHLRVRSLLAVASDERTTAEKAVACLEQARAVAESPEDRIETALALGDHFVRHAEPMKACRQYLSLALSAAGDEMVSLEQGFSQRARLLANRRMAEAASRLSAGERDTLLMHSRRFLSEAVSKRDTEGLLWLSESDAAGEASHEAKMRLAAWSIEDLQFERAESLLREVLSHAQPPAQQAEAAARLASIFLLPAELHLPVSALELLDRLEREWAGVELPSEILLDPLESSARKDGEALGKTTAAGIAKELRQRLDRKMLEQRKAWMTPFRLAGARAVRKTAGENAWPLITRNEGNEATRATMVWLVENKRVAARRSEDQTNLWQADLKLPGQAAIDVAAETAALRTAPNILTLGQDTSNAWVGPVASGPVDGQTLILNSSFGLHAVGLLTGRRLWSRPFEAPYAPETVASDLWVWVHDGHLITLDGSNRLEVARASDGNRILWNRVMPQRQWRIVRARGQYVVAADRSLQKVDLFRLADGGHIGQCKFSQPKGLAGTINLLLFDDVICGPVSNNEVAAFEVIAPGSERWRATLPEQLSQIFKPAPDLVAVSDQGGKLQLHEASTGRSRRQPMLPPCPEGAIDGALIDGVLYLIGYQSRPRITATRPQEFQPWTYCLAAVRAEDGRILWQRDNVAPGTYLTGDILRASSNAIPLAAVVRRFPETAADSGASKAQEVNIARMDRSRSAPMIELTVVDKSTGRSIGQPLATPLPEGTRSAPVLDVLALPGEIVVRAGPYTIRFGMNASAPGATAEKGGK